MQFKIEFKPTFRASLFEAESYLYKLSPRASDNFYSDVTQKIEELRKLPFMYQTFDDDPYFRSIPLLYAYRLFYHVDEKQKCVFLAVILRGMMDLNEKLKAEK